MALLAHCRSTSDSPDVVAGGKLNGLHKYYYPDGSLYMEVNFKDSIPDGATRQYFKNGQVFEETWYIEGVRHGTSRRFYEDGKPSMETPYDSGRIHGIQRKFRKDGTKAYEAPYHFDNPCVGLKEYYLNGQPVANRPQIIIKPKDELWREFRYTLEIGLSEKAKVEFFKGELTDGRYIGKQAEKLFVDRQGRASIVYNLAPGDFVMEKINIIAKIRTDLGNSYITQIPYTVAIKNQ
ncbi:MAG TPA: hypothetical protein VEB86_08690 [Chryseosolibacter sp.]|nr:hypothetical protein [Chryseosolibacter sp.]